MEHRARAGRERTETRLAARYLEALVAGERSRVEGVVGDALDQGIAPPTLLLRVMAPALRAVGEMWHRGELSAAREHWASEATLDELERVRLARPPARLLGLEAVVGVAEGEVHVLPARIVGALLGWRGWRVDFLGASLPAEDLAEFARQRRPDLVALSLTLRDHLPGLLGAIAALRRLDPTPRILVGGAGCEGSVDALLSAGADAVAVDALDGISRIEALLGAAGAPTDAAGYLSLVGRRVREVRQRLGLSQGDLAERAGLARPYLSAVERGRQNLTIESLLRLATALAVPVEELLREVG